MSAAKHTPGPWIERWPDDCGNDAVGLFRVGAIGQKVFLRIATVDLQTVGEATHSYEFAKAERKANAKLIAAAPALADALEALLPHCRVTGNDDAERVQAARAALRAAGRLP